ncbi:FkbM family methyltransferase [Acidovorax sp. ACV02]|uniref:FkbM family methyltransferase n=1 Tax=Acidovorax sp. ACV02 TaxID=2769310 RepID=UPI0017837DD2|nr:FkbM family methyltransferase [Acidovorax sp. ACV02]MBD9408312.1 FkbM family methyltransferase [Acidovorax sp. ACV02]
MSLADDYKIYVEKMGAAFRAHNIDISGGELGFSEIALLEAQGGDWSQAVIEFKDGLEQLLAGKLSSGHHFLKKPYIRKFQFDSDEALSVAIVNEQSLEWYGRDGAEHAFDFLLESKRGLFRKSNRYLDLGGHQMVWACYYALQRGAEEVVSYEPSILNVAIGIFNCFLNGVIKIVNVVPFAVLASNASVGDENSKMLVDFMTMPLRGFRIDRMHDLNFDFVKTDIEGYEFDLLRCPCYIEILKRAQYSHLELHLGHLCSRGIDVDMWMDRLRFAELNGEELYSGCDMFEFLAEASPKGFYSFILK